MRSFFLCTQNNDSKNYGFYQSLFSDFVTTEFPKTPSPKPARIPPQTPPAGGKSADAGRLHMPRKIVCPAASALVLLKKSSSKVYNYSTNNKSRFETAFVICARDRT